MQTPFTNILPPHSVQQMLAKQQHNHLRTVASLNTRDRAAIRLSMCSQNRGQQLTVHTVLSYGPAAHPTPSKNYLNDFYFLKSSKRIGVFKLVFIFKFSFSWQFFTTIQPNCNQVFNWYHLPCYRKSVIILSLNSCRNVGTDTLSKVQFILSLGIYKPSVLQQRSNDPAKKPQLWV